MSNGRKRIAVFGGVFDPVHNGHIKCAEIADRELSPDELIFMPAGRPPHKIKLMNTAKDRMNMLQIAVSERFGGRAKVCGFEAESGEISYTSETLAYLRSIYGMDADIFFVIGSDNIQNIKSWHKPEIIRTLATLAVVKRPGYDEAEAKAVLPECVILGGESIEDSSTEIRRRAALGEDFSELVPCGVYEYIKKNNLYPKAADESEIEEFVKKKLRPKRFEHTLGVRDTAVRLAEKHGADTGKVKIAALVHDSAKNLSLPEMLKLCEKYDIITDELQKRQETLLHGIAAEGIAFFELGITDGDILDAVRYHTTGRKDMPLLTKIIYLADCIEPSRDYGGVEELRRLSLENLDGACRASLDSTISFLISKGAEIHTDTLEARNSLIRGEMRD